MIKDERPSNQYSLSFQARVFNLQPFLPRQGEVLDIGCGEGYLSRILIENGCRVTGIDYSPEAIEKAARLPGRFLVRDIYDFRPKKKFDWVVCSEVLEHLPDDRLALKLMASWLKPKGRILLSVPTKMKLTEKLRKIGGHHRHYRVEELVKIMADLGFRLEKRKDWGCLIRNIILCYFPGISQGKPPKIISFFGQLLRPLIVLDTLLWPFPDSVILIFQKK